MADTEEAQEPLEGELLPVMREDFEEDENLGGRPRLYDTPEQFNEAVNDYYQAVQRTPGEPLTLTGLCLHMGFSGRDALFRYATYDGFLYAVTRARTLIEYGYEKVAITQKNQAAARLLACIGGDDFWNPATKINVGEARSHEDWLEHLR